MWFGQQRQRREGRERPHQVVVIDRMQAAAQGQHVLAAQSIVLRYDHQVPQPRVQPGIEDLRDLRATLAQQAGGQCGLAATADGDLWWRGQQGIECGTIRMLDVRPAVWGECPRQQAGLQHAFVDPARQRMRQGRGLARVAGAAVVAGGQLHLLDCCRVDCFKNSMIRSDKS